MKNSRKIEETDFSINQTEINSSQRQQSSNYLNVELISNKPNFEEHNIQWIDKELFPNPSVFM